VDDLDTVAHNSRLRAQVLTEQKRVGQRVEYGSAGCGQPLTSDVDQRCGAVVANRAEAGWRYFHFLGLPEVKRLLLSRFVPRLRTYR